MHRAVTWMFYPYWTGCIIETLFDGASPKLGEKPVRNVLNESIRIRMLYGCYMAIRISM